jgi:hypothetical protein
MQVDYYWDDKCSQYALGIKNPPNGGIFGYQYTNTNSANVANCSGGANYCYCYFYTEANGAGTSDYAVWGGNNCASNPGAGFQSFKCTYGYSLTKEKRIFEGNF